MICAESDDLTTLATALQVRSLRPDVRVVVHLDNPATHLGLESAAALAGKYEQSVGNFARVIRGVFRAIDEAGRLILETGDGEAAIDAGDVFLASPPHGA